MGAFKPLPANHLPLRNSQTANESLQCLRDILPVNNRVHSSNDYQLQRQFQVRIGGDLWPPLLAAR